MHKQCCQNFNKLSQKKDEIYDLVSACNAVEPKTLWRGWKKLLFLVNFVLIQQIKNLKDLHQQKKNKLNEIIEAVKNGITLTYIYARIRKLNCMNKNIPGSETLTEEKLIKTMTAPDGETNDVSSESKGKIMKGMENKVK